jgi:hypothetical protein
VSVSEREKGAQLGHTVILTVTVAFSH